MPLNLIFIQPGNYTIDDNGIPGDNISVIRDGNGVVIFTFGHPADGLGFTVSTTGVNITVNFTDSMNAANFTIGSTDPDPMVGPPQSPDSIVMKNIVTTGTVTLVSNTTITEGGSDSASDITAGALIMSAVSGVGTTVNAIETRTGLFEAETTTGGVNIRNIGSVQIGGISADVDGLDVATSGNINFVNIGSIFLTEANTVTASEVVHAGGSSGNVTLVASGVNADIIGNVDNGAVTVPRGSATLTAGRDIQLGTIGADFNNDIITNNNLTLTAGRDILIDGFADLLSDNFGLDTGGDLTFTAGRNIGILNLAGTSASVTASGSGGGHAFITTGFGGALTVNGPGSFALGSTSGDVLISADRVLIDGGSGISAPSGQITIQPRTEGRAMFLGSAGDAAFAIELSDLELNRLFTPTLNLGSMGGGRVRVIAPVAPISPGNATNITIRSSSDIQVDSNITTIGDLTLRAGNNVYQSAVSVITAGGLFHAFADDIQDDLNAGGQGYLAGTITGSSVRLTGNLDADTLTGTDADNLLFGLGGADKLFGRGGNDSLDGGTGNDTMTGGLGDDVYFTDSTTDVVVEAVGEGTDTVQSTATFTLTANVERLTLAGSANINGTGNDLDNLIFGNTGNNLLNGGTGADSLRGGIGDDTYVVDNVADSVVENAGQGTDLVNSSVTFTLGVNVENLTLTGAGAINGTGNTLANVITGNVGANILNGAVGADTMAGSVGNDTYVVDNAGDVVTENAASGTDTVESSITFTLGANVENLTLTGLLAINGTGNTLANVIHGNGGANTLTGDDGADDLFGGAGNDDLNGGTGADKFRFDTALSAAGNVDDILDFLVLDDTIFLDRDIFTGILANGTLAASAFRGGLVASDGDDRIIYDIISGNIFYDADGIGATAQILFATVTPGTLLTNADFTAYI